MSISFVANFLEKPGQYIPVDDKCDTEHDSIVLLRAYGNSPIAAFVP